MSTFADRNDPMVMAEQRRIRAEQETAEPPATIAARVGRLVQSYLSPPYFGLGSMGGGSTLEAANVARWRAKLGDEAAELWADAVGLDPEAVRIIELVQYSSGFVPGSSSAIKSTEEVREKYRLEMARVFR